MTETSQRIIRTSSHARPACSCGWQGVSYPTRTIEGIALARRAAADHLYAHEHHTGFFDFVNGWTAC